MKAESKIGSVSDRNKKFYVYVYRDPRPGKDRAPIYVGKGKPSSRRARSHLKYTHNAFLANILAKILAAGLEPDIEIVAWFDHEQDAFDLEQKLIAAYGRRDLGLGTLVNLADGGDGPNGRIVSEKEKERAGKMGAAVWADEKARTKLLNALIMAAKKSWATERQFRLDRIADGNLRRRQDPIRHNQFVELRRSRATQQWSDPAHRVVHAKANREANIAAWSDLAHRTAREVAIKAGIVAAMQDAGKRQRRLTHVRSIAARGAAASNAAWKDPAKRAERIAKMRATRQARAQTKPLREAE